MVENQGGREEGRGSIWTDFPFWRPGRTGLVDNTKTDPLPSSEPGLPGVQVLRWAGGSGQGRGEGGGRFVEVYD